jgi:hypothetical protein
MDEIHTFMQNVSKATYTVAGQNFRFLDEEVKLRRKWEIFLR